MASIDGAHRFSRIRTVSFSGEPLYEKDVELFRKHFSERCLLINTFGSTEVSSFCEYVVDGQTRFDLGRVPCGYPAADMEVFVVDEANNPVAANQVGEIAVRSRYLALEYWRNPALTESKFLPDPRNAGSRTYLTGDLGRILADGCLLFVGRKDFQVKIRGYRVELEEIEAALLALGTVKEAAVFAGADALNETRLVACVVPKADATTLTTSGYRRALKESLPDHMIPAVFVTLERLPLTRNGKIDRRALPDPSNSRPEIDTPYVSPRTPMEEKLARIWAEILTLDRVGIHDNFFDLGGHSLAATRVISQVLKQFQTEVALQLLFQSPTIAEMAAVITEHQGKKLDNKELGRILTELESLSEDEAQRLVANPSQKDDRHGAR
jgi:acyl carrier protein